MTDQEADALFADVEKARAAIVAEAGPHRRGVPVAGTMPCPVCGEAYLRWSRAASNGHIHARCTKEGCVSWME